MGEIKEGFDKFKAWYKSKTIVGIIITVVALILDWVLPGAEIDVQGTADLVIEEGEAIATGIDNIYLKVMEVLGLILAAFGRFKAKTGIK